MKKSFRILIVEDEPIESRALVMMLKYNRRDIEEIQTADNGIDALKIYQSLTPDIVLMDINLPGINGLDLIRRMRATNHAASFVIVSAHNQFSYAQEAIRLDVLDFIVKPIRLDDINQVLDEVIVSIEQNHSREELVRQQEAKLDAIRPVLERDCIFSIASMRSNTPVATIFDFMRIPITSGFVFAVRGNDKNGLMLREIKLRLRNMGLHSIGEIINGVCVCVALSSEMIRQTQSQETITYLSEALCNVGYDCQIGVGSVANCADGLRHSFEQAMVSVREASETGARLSFQVQSQPDEQHTFVDISDYSIKICQSIRLGQSKEIAENVHSFFKVYQMSTDFYQIQEAAYCLYIMVIGNFPEKAQELKQLSVAQFFSTQDISALHIILTQAFTQLMEPNKTIMTGQPNQLVNCAIEIIRKNFRSDITLDSVAEELNVSSFYLSKLFRKHTNFSFTEYLTQQRIQYAKSLLDKGEANIKEVTYAAGFNSQSYFSKIFKKYVGIAPSKYKEVSEQSDQS